MKKRIKTTYKYKMGDIIKADLPGTKIKHICVVLENEDSLGHVKCLPVCNFTTKQGSISDYSIDISKYQLPEHWFEKGTKTDSWIRCNEVDCIYNLNLSKADVLGNILIDYNDLWKEVCQAVYSCKVSTRLEKICDCEYDEINSAIEKGEIPIPDCGCN
jgi:hypothetical protein